MLTPSPVHARNPDYTIKALLVAALFLFAAALVSSAKARAAEPASWKHEWPQTDFSQTSVEFREILSGGPPKDGIPAIDEPKFAPIAEISTVADREPVIGLEINGEARAYPLSVLTWHEIANDVLGGVPVAVTYCPLCNAAIVFDRTIEGSPTTFGTTGKLRKSDLVMYDRATESWWQQFTGEAIVGERLGMKLKMLPSRLESYASFKARFPAGTVLIPNNPEMRAYGRNPYFGYDSRQGPYPFFQGDLPEGIPAMARVIVIENDGQPHAVSMALVQEKGSFTIGDASLSWSAGQASALDSDAIAAGRDVGNVVVQRPGKDGKMEDVRYDVTFAFVFHAFHPGLKIQTE